MSGVVNRPFTIAMAADNPPADGPRSMGNGRHSPTSPLKLFGQAKNKINDIFRDMRQYIEESGKFLTDVNGDEGLMEAAKVDEVRDYKVKVDRITEMLKRDRMKVAFFGRTSNGKSTTINAMLRHKILPQGIGHTTNCFVQVEGSDEPEPYMLADASDARLPIQSINQLAHALSKVKVEEKSCVRIMWPKQKCHLLRDDVVLVDSPGIDVSPNLDSWIDSHCLDADVFVLVANAESTLMQTEKNFFHKVSSKLSKPNIFILQNRWDASAAEPETMQMVKEQHIDRNKEFLVKELNVASSEEAEDRVFFVSAREALASRLDSGQNTPTPTTVMAEGYQGRLFEFKTFERKFEECISKSAVQTKFKQHTNNGQAIIGELRNTMEEVTTQSNEARTRCESKHRETQDKLDYTEKQLELLSSEIKEKIKQMTENVERKVASALTDEIRRLALLVDEFDRPFHPDSMFLAIYKKELHAHLEEMLGRNVQNQCSSALHGAVESTQTQMTERLSALLPEEIKQQAATWIPRKESFEMAYKFDCRNLFVDFQEDLEFKFSFGIQQLMNRFMGPAKTRAVMAGIPDIPRPLAMTPQTPSNEVRPANENELMIQALAMFGSLYSRTTIGMLAITGIVTKAAGWRVIAICGAIYTLLYVYERLMWTNKAKERTFKEQYVGYATSKLKLVVDFIGSNCSHQVQQELTSTFSKLVNQVDLAKGDLVEELTKLQKEISRLDDVGNKSKVLKNKAVWLDNELKTFQDQHLKESAV